MWWNSGRESITYSVGSFIGVVTVLYYEVEQ